MLRKEFTQRKKWREKSSLQIKKSGKRKGVQKKLLIDKSYESDG